MINKILVSAILFGIILLNSTKAEIKGSWKKEFTGEIAKVAFSAKGDMVVISVNYKNKEIPESSTCEIFCLKTSNGAIQWNEQLFGLLTELGGDQDFIDNDKYIAVFTIVLNTFEATDYTDDDILYVFSRDGSLLWKMNRHYQVKFSPSYKYLAEFGEIEDEIEDAGEAKYRIIVRTTNTGEIVDNIPVNEGVFWAKFVTDTTIAFTSLGPFLQLKNINSKKLIKVALDSGCDKYSFGGVSQGEITRIVVICKSYLQIFNEKLNLLQKTSVEGVPVLDSIPKNAIELYHKDIGMDLYFSSKGEFLGDYQAPSPDSGKNGINEFEKFVSKYREEWSRYYNSADGKHIIAVLKDGKTIQYLPYVSK